MALISLPPTFSFSFLKYKGLSFVLLLLMMITVLLGYHFRGLNLGVDFRGGTIIEVETKQPVDINALRTQLRHTIKHDVTVQSVGKGATELLLRTDIQDPKLLASIRPILGESAVYHKIETIGPKVGKELIKNGALAIFWALLAMMAYVWLRFEWQFSVCAFVALLHDCLGLLAFFMWTQFEFNESAVVAILITAAYSINDTVVIFDRLREKRLENQGKGVAFSDLVNASLNETLSRTLLTSSTALLALVMLYFFGGDVISTLSLPILMGIIVGTYSSVVIAVPLLIWLPQSPLKPEHEIIDANTGH